MTFNHWRLHQQCSQYISKKQCHTTLVLSLLLSPSSPVTTTFLCAHFGIMSEYHTSPANTTLCQVLSGQCAYQYRD
jgi:hypothetical protein